VAIAPTPPPPVALSKPSLVTSTSIVKGKWDDRNLRIRHNPPVFTDINTANAAVIICNNLPTGHGDGDYIDKCKTVIRLSQPMNTTDTRYIGTRTDMVIVPLAGALRVDDVRHVKPHNIWVDMQAHYGQSVYLKKKFGRHNPAPRNKNHGIQGVIIDYRSVNVIDDKFFKKYGAMPLEISTLLWYLDQSNSDTIILYGIDMTSLPSRWSNLLHQLSSVVIMNKE